MSKRKLLQLVKEGFVSGWDDPRMPTLSGMRRRGYTPQAIRAFADTIGDTIGVSKANSVVDLELLEHVIRDDLNNRARRVMAVLEPLKVIIDNYPEAQEKTAPRGRCPSAGRCTSSARTLWKNRLRSSSGWHRARKCA